MVKGIINFWPGRPTSIVTGLSVGFEFYGQVMSDSMPGK